MNTFSSSFVALSLLGIVACGDDTAAGGNGGTGGQAQAGEAEGGKGGEVLEGGNGGTAEGGGSELPSVELVKAFDPAAFELPEGLVLDADQAYVGFAFTGAVQTLSLSGDEAEDFAAAPAPPSDSAFVTGLALDEQGALYIAYASFDPARAAGIYRAEPGGGEATLWSSHPQLNFPNGFAFDDSGTLYVTDSAAGAVFRVDALGTAEVWVTDPLLAPDATACGQDASIAVGANGLAFSEGAFYVASSDQGALLRIAIEASGAAGAIETIAGPSCDLGGIDGIALDGTGLVYAAINRANKIVAIDADGSFATIAQGSPLDFPATIAFADSGDLYVTSFALAAFLSGGDPHPSLVRIGL